MTVCINRNWERAYEFTDKYIKRAQTFHTDKKLNDKRMSTSESLGDFKHKMGKKCLILGKGDVEYISRIIPNASPEIQSYLLDKNLRTMDELQKYAWRAKQIAKLSKMERADVAAIKLHFLHYWIGWRAWLKCNMLVSKSKDQFPAGIHRSGTVRCVSNVDVPVHSAATLFLL